MATLHSLYSNKDDRYFSTPCSGILPLLPQSANRVLEIGCGEGTTLSWIQNTLHASWVGGVELNEEAAKAAAQKLDWLCQGDFEAMELPFEENSIDLVLCLDVLEHLVDPWSAIRKLTRLISPGGSLIASIPNIRHHSVTLPLILRGEWKYGNKDILDITHLRFFTKQASIELVQIGGLRVNEVLTAKLAKGSKSWLANLISFGLLRQFFVFQYLIKASKA
jgi:2-polyprenyl-3-methyl-5-hydroxy-6-metoxy-1,4-benzoquinol methylase